MTSKISDTFSAIEQWAEDRNIFNGSNDQAQFIKLMEEVGELANAMGKGNVDLIKDAIGDTIVVLTIIGKFYDLTIEECVEAAYNEIKDRKGKMINGIFVKEESTQKEGNQ